MSKILITGGTGMIGTRLTEILESRGHEVSVLGRSKKPNRKSFTWDLEKRVVEPGALGGVEAIIHLAGAGIGDKPWTENRKRVILESRTHSTRLLYDELKRGGHTVKSFISASGISFYGVNDPDREYNESDPPGDDFLAEVVKKWEGEVEQIKSLGIRVVKVRGGIVLSEKGGALKEIARPVKFYVGAPLGTGNQSVSWIHIDDLCGIFVKAVEDPLMVGTYNGVGPYPVTNRELTKAIARVLKRPLIIPRVPSWALKILFGEMADLVLYGNKVSAQRLMSAGFKYKFSTLEAALEDLLGDHS